MILGPVCLPNGQPLGNPDSDEQRHMKEQVVGRERRAVHIGQRAIPGER